MNDEPLYYIVINEKEKTFNSFDEDGLKMLPNEDFIVCKIKGDENCNTVLELLWTVLPEYKKVETFLD